MRGSRASILGEGEETNIEIMLKVREFIVLWWFPMI